MDEAESHMTSAAAFVDGGIQEACDDTCSICLEGFCDSDPSTVTSCKHEFHLQCVLECVPEKLQLSNVLAEYHQELLEAVERERSFRFSPSRNARIFHHSILGDFELQHLHVGVNDTELEDRIIQHLAVAAAMGRTQRIARREGRIRSSAHARQFMVYSPHPNDSSTGSGGDETEAAVLTENDGSIQDIYPSVQGNNQISSGSSVMPITGRELPSGDRNSVSQSSLPNQERAGPSEFQSFSDTWKSRFSSVSMKDIIAKIFDDVSNSVRPTNGRYKESISKSAKEVKDRFFSRSSTMADIGSEVKREVNAGIATVSRMMERLEARDSNRGVHVDGNSSVSSSVTERINSNRTTPDDTPLNGNSSASFAANSISN
ncbi:hypothetical protein OROGR_018629 [Orobanche gracilis]